MKWTLILSFMLTLISDVYAFHPDIYQPRVPKEILEDTQEQDNPFEEIPGALEIGEKIYFGKGLCVTCHSKNGKGVKLPGHSPRDFSDEKWQDIRSDGELMWVLKNGSPGTGMPVRVGKVITEEEGWQVILFIRQFSGK